MAKNITELKPALEKHLASQSQTAIVGQVKSLTDDGMAMVDWEGNEGGPVEALTTVQLAELLLPVNVLLLFTQSRMRAPVIVGVTHESLLAPKQENDPEPALKKISADELFIEGRETVEISTGKASITLQKNGRIVVKGVDLVSRATRSNKLRGSSIFIN